MDKLDSWVQLLVWIHDNIVNLPLNVINTITDLKNIKGALGNPTLIGGVETTILGIATGMSVIFFLMRIFSSINSVDNIDFLAIIKPATIGIMFIGLTKGSYALSWTILGLGKKIVDGFSHSKIATSNSTLWIEALLKDRELGGQIVASLFIIVTFAITCFCYISVIGLVIGRTINLFVNLYVSPIFVAMLGSEKLSGMGASFLKTMFTNYISIVPIYILFGAVQGLPKFLGGSSGQELGLSLVGALILWKLSTEVSDLINRIVNS